MKEKRIRAKKNQKHTDTTSSLEKSLSCKLVKLGEYPRSSHHQRLIPLLMLLPKAATNGHCHRENTEAHKPSAWPRSAPLMFPWLLITNLNPSAAVQENKMKGPCIQTLQPSHLQLKGRGVAFMWLQHFRASLIFYGMMKKSQCRSRAVFSQHPWRSSRNTPRQGKADSQPCLFMNVCKRSTVSRKADNTTCKLGKQIRLVPWDIKQKKQNKTNKKRQI